MQVHFTAPSLGTCTAELPSASVTPLARDPCSLTSRDGRLLIWEWDPRSETIVMYSALKSWKPQLEKLRPMGVELLTNTLGDRHPYPTKPLGLWDLGTSLPLYRSIILHGALHNITPPIREGGVLVTKHLALDLSRFNLASFPLTPPD